MSRYVNIVSEDIRFARMLALELEALGYESVTSFEGIEGAGEKLVIADLDTCLEEELSSYAKQAKLIGFYKKDELNLIKSDFCSTVFRRPFLMSAFLSHFTSNGIEHKYERKSKPRETSQLSIKLSLDKNNRSAIYGDLNIPLSEYEYKVLELLFRNKGKIVERETIDDLLGSGEGNMGDVYICHLRRKIDNKLGLKLIYTVRGQGYMLKS